MTEFRHTDDRLVHEGGVWNVVVGSFLDPDGESFTRDIVRAGKVLKIDVLDHIILGRRTTARGKDYVSLRELGYIYE